MINLFNLFLFLFALWIFLITASGTFSWFYLCFGLSACALVSFVSWKIKIINRNSEFLFLNFSFYKHFIRIIAISFFRSIYLVIKLAFTDANNLKPVVYNIPIQKRIDPDLTLLIISVTLLPGIICVGIKEERIIIHAIDEKYIYKANLVQIYKNLYQVKDERLV